MKRNESLLKKVEYFEKLAVHGDREIFLKSLAQPWGPGETFAPNMDLNVPQSDIDRSQLGPGLTTFPTMNEKVDNSIHRRPLIKSYKVLKDGDFINPKVQTALKMLYPNLNISVDSTVGTNTRGALNRYKLEFHDDRDLADPALQDNIIADAYGKKLHNQLDSMTPKTSATIPLFEKLAVGKTVIDDLFNSTK